jgi:hypothetical protein
VIELLVLFQPSVPSPKSVEVAFDTGPGSGDIAKGFMFTITAEANLSIKSFELVGSKDGGGDVMIYTRQGSYEGYEKNSNGWTLILDGTINLKKNVPVYAGDFISDVRIARGSTVSFYVWSKKAMIFERRNDEGSVFKSDGSLTVKVGITMDKNLFKPKGIGSVFSGIIRYQNE